MCARRKSTISENITIHMALGCRSVGGVETVKQKQRSRDQRRSHDQDLLTRVPEPHMGRAARNCIAVLLVSRAFHPVRCTRFPDWLDTDQTEGCGCVHDTSGDHVHRFALFSACHLPRLRFPKVIHELFRLIIMIFAV